MPRPHIEFLHAQQLDWQPSAFAGACFAGTAVKMLSRDTGSGACSLLLRLPAGFAAPPTQFAALFELYVLDGAMDLNGEAFSLDCYSALPAGLPLKNWSSRAGATLLAFFDREPAATPPRERVRYDASLHVPRIDTHNTPWTSHDIDPSVQFLRLSHKVLRHVPATGEKTILLASGAQAHPRDWREAQLRHNCAEEMYLLGGDIIGERGTMYEGAYFWRPPGAWHGPFGSRRGSLSIIRFAEGQHTNEWGKEVLDFALVPLHAPQLPNTTPAAARRAWQPPQY
jgi:hypothetical protein